MRLHGEVAAWLAAADPAAPQPGQPGIDLAALRAAPPPPGLGVGDEVEHVEDLVLAGVACRLYRPRPGVRAVVHVHGGGWVAGDLDSHDALCRLLAARSGLALVAVDYRRPPEHPWPAPLEDVEVVADALVRGSGEAVGLVADRLGLVGDSAGAQLALAAALRARRRGGPHYAALALVYPAVDARRRSASHRLAGVGLTTGSMRWYWDQLVGGDDGLLDDPLVSAADADPTDLAGLPPSTVVTAEHDVLRDEGEALAERLAEAGVPVVATRALGQVHGFARHPAVFPAAAATADLVAGRLRSALG